MCSDCRIDGSATLTTVLSSMITNSPTDTAPSVHHFLFSGVTNLFIPRPPSTLVRAKLAHANREAASRLARVSEVVWTPDEATVERANATRLLRGTGLASFAELQRRSWQGAGGVLAPLIHDPRAPVSPPRGR